MKTTKKLKSEFDNQLMIIDDLFSFIVVGFEELKQPAKKEVKKAKEMNFALNFLIVFTPKQKGEFPNTRFLVSAKQLHRYIGKENAKTALSKIENSQEDKITIKFKKHGKLNIYAK